MRTAGAVMGAAILLGIAGCGNDTELSEGSATPTPQEHRVDGPAIQVVLSWTPAADVDLHVVAPGGQLFTDLDCQPQSPCDPAQWHPDYAPPMDWGEAGVVEDDPTARSRRGTRSIPRTVRRDATRRRR